jgi:hypothetical protein
MSDISRQANDKRQSHEDAKCPTGPEPLETCGTTSLTHEADTVLRRGAVLHDSDGTHVCADPAVLESSIQVMKTQFNTMPPWYPCA